MRKSSGLANKYRTGRSTYSIRNKSRAADLYGQWMNGRQLRSENIAGKTLSYSATTGEWSRHVAA